MNTLRTDYDSNATPILNSPAMVLPLANVMLNLDVFKIDQVIRNLVTNAVPYETTFEETLVMSKLTSDEVHPRGRHCSCSHQQQVRS